MGGWLRWTQWERVVGVGVDVSANVWVNWINGLDFFFSGSLVLLESQLQSQLHCNYREKHTREQRGKSHPYAIPFSYSLTSSHPQNKITD